jgi:hypothetical protein
VDKNWLSPNPRSLSLEWAINTLLNPEARTVVEGQTRAAMLEFIFLAKLKL